MKRLISVFVILCMLTGFTACNNQNSKVNQVIATTMTSDTTPYSSEVENTLSNTEGIDIDLTILSSTMVYAEVYDIVYNPKMYLGKNIRMQGICSVYVDPYTENVYYACIIQDATACCSQGLEFVLLNTEEYPEDGAEITVTGTFATYEENGNIFMRLEDSTMS